MITTTALEAQNRARAEQPLALVITRRRSPQSDDAVRAVAAAARELQIEALALDVDDAQNRAFVDELKVAFVPEMILFQRGLVVERACVPSADDALDLMLASLRRSRR